MNTLLRLITDAQQALHDLDPSDEKSMAAKRKAYEAISKARIIAAEWNDKLTAYRAGFKDGSSR